MADKEDGDTKGGDCFEYDVVPGAQVFYPAKLCVWNLVVRDVFMGLQRESGKENLKGTLRLVTRLYRISGHQKSFYGGGRLENGNTKLASQGKGSLEKRISLDKNECGARTVQDGDNEIVEVQFWRWMLSFLRPMKIVVPQNVESSFSIMVQG
eukprot:Selendium_serpulae@DN8471_c0_g1_i1.p1